MAGWHHQCNGYELGQTLGDGEEQRGLACCSPWGCKELDIAHKFLMFDCICKIELKMLLQFSYKGDGEVQSDIQMYGNL